MRSQLTLSCLGSSQLQFQELWVMEEENLLSEKEEKKPYTGMFGPRRNTHQKQHS